MSGNPDALLDTIRHIVREEMRRLQTATLAIVQDIHPHASASDEDNYACTVKLQDSELVLNKVPVATARMGLTSIPAVNDLVLVQFINGDINSPVITGSLYNDEDRPPVNADGQWVYQLPLGAAEGEGVHLSISSADTPSLDLKIGGSMVLSLKDDDPVVSLDVGSGAATLTIDSDGAVALKSSRDLTLEAGAKLLLKGQSIKAEGAAEVTVKGGVINLN